MSKKRVVGTAWTNDGENYFFTPESEEDGEEGPIDFNGIEPRDICSVGVTADEVVAGRSITGDKWVYLD